MRAVRIPTARHPAYVAGLCEHPFVKPPKPAPADLKRGASIHAGFPDFHFHGNDRHTAQVENGGQAAYDAHAEGHAQGGWDVRAASEACDECGMQDVRGRHDTSTAHLPCRWGAAHPGSAVSNAGPLSNTRHGKTPLAVFILIIASILSFPLCSVLFIQSAFAVSSINVPLDDWSYDALERLSGFGLLNSDMKGTKPYTRMETARLVLEALYEKEKKGKEYKLPELAEYFLQRFQKEYRDELAQLGWGEGYTGGNSLKPLNEVKVRYVYVDGKPINLGGFQDHSGGIIGTEGTPLVYNNEGIVYGENHNASLQFSSSVQFLGIFSGYVEPIFLARQNNGDLQNFGGNEVDLFKGYAKASPWNVELEVGRDSLWWGQGHHGTLLLTDNAGPLDMIKLSNPNPVLLPWIFSYLGPFKYTVFCAQLESDRDHPNAMLGGMRLDFKPTPNFEMGMSRTFIFGGDGMPNNSFLGFLKILSFLNVGGSLSDFTNQIASFDFRYRLPSLRNSEIYLEWGGDDTRNVPDLRHGLFNLNAYLVGFYLPRLTSDGLTDLRIEYADNVTEPSDPDFPAAWYTHSQYFSGYTYNGLILGHPMGPDARDAYARVTRYLRNDLLLGLDFDWMQRGRNLGPVTEYSYQVGADASYDITSSITVKLRYGFEQVENYNLKAGVDRGNNLILTELKWRF